MRTSPPLPAFVARPVASLAFPRLIAVVVASFSMTLLVVGARSPYTHSNLLPAFDPGYTRTEQIRVGPAEPYAGIGDSSSAAVADPVARGARLFVTKGCVACHALDGAGGPVAPAIAGVSLDKVLTKTRNGPAGMPQYTTATLTDDEAAAIAAYLGSLKPAK